MSDQPQMRVETRGYLCSFAHTHNRAASVAAVWGRLGRRESGGQLDVNTCTGCQLDDSGHASSIVTAAFHFQDLISSHCARSHA